MSLCRSLLAGALCAFAAACVHYQPAPIDPAAAVATRAARQLAPATPGTTADLLAVAIDWSPAIRESAAAYRSAVAAQRAARAPLPLALQLTAEYSRDDNPDKPWLGAGALDLPVDLGGRRRTRLAAADLPVAQARYDYGEAIWTVRSAIRRALVERVTVDRLAPLAERALALRQDRSAKLRARMRAGEEAQPVPIAAELELAAAERRVRDIAARGVQARIALANAIGADPGSVTGLAPRPLDAIPAFTPADLTRLRGQAASGRRDVLRAIVDYDIAENALRQEIANQYPAIRIQPGYTYERGLVKLPFGLNLALPGRDLNRAAIAAAAQRRAQAALRLETVQATVLGDIDRTAAALDAQRAAEGLVAAQDLPVARRMAAAAAASLKAGETDRVDEDAARVTAVETEITLLEASRLAWLALVDLEDALRRPSDPREGAVLEAAMARLGETR